MCMAHGHFIPFLMTPVPQIIQNVTRGAARQSLRREYIIGITLGRLALPLYVWGCPNNLLSMDTSRELLHLRALYQRVGI